MKNNVKNCNNTGILYIVPTPIGNMSDITKRALMILNIVDIIACENIRHSYILLKKYNINSSLTAIHKYNEYKKSIILIKQLNKGKNIALISNAGTPLINDPGYILVNLCYDNNIKIVPIPGACSAITALIASGLPSNKFCYEGFLPSQKNSRQKILFSLRKETRTIIFYETSNRLLSSIKDIITLLGGDRIVVVARELTKYWEHIHKSSAQHLLNWLSLDKHRCKGEIVLIIQGYTITNSKNISYHIHDTLNLLKTIIPLKLAISITAKIHKINKNKLYNYAINLKK